MLKVVQTSFHMNRICQTNNNPNYCFYRHEVITKLQKEYSLVNMITINLATYYDTIRALVNDKSEDFDPEQLLPDGRYSHVIQVQERLNFMKYLLKEGQLWLLEPQAQSVWKCLAQNSVFECDREYCFKWFSRLMNDDNPDLEPDVNKRFFEEYVIKLDPKLLTDSGIK